MGGWNDTDGPFRSKVFRSLHAACGLGRDDTWRVPWTEDVLTRLRRRSFDYARFAHFCPGLIPATSIVATVLLDSSLVSVDLRTDEISSTGGHRFFAPFFTEKEPLALSPGAPNPRMTPGGSATGTVTGFRFWNGIVPNRPDNRGYFSKAVLFLFCRSL